MEYPFLFMVCNVEKCLGREEFMANKKMFLMILLLSLSMGGCVPQEGQAAEVVATQGISGDREAVGEEEQTVEKLQLLMNGKTFVVTMEHTAAAQALVAMLPMTIDMQELNGNEKYHYLSKSLPVDPSVPEQIHAGDLMLYGSDCMVLFYKTFSTSYRYTALGKIDDPEGLKEAVGTGNVKVTLQAE